MLPFQYFLNCADCVEFQADVETDEVYAQMTLQPLSPVTLSSSCAEYR